MATVKLVIRENKATAEGSCIIYLLYTHDQKTVQFSTNEKVPVDQWDAKAQKVRRSWRGFTSLNDAIWDKKASLEQFVRELKLQGIEPTTTYVKENFGKVAVTTEQVATIDPKLAAPLLEVWHIYLKGQQLYTPATVARFNSVKQQIIQFLAKQPGCTCTHFNKQKGTDFLHFLQDRGFQNNTIGSYMMTVKTVLAWALEHGYSTNDDFKRFVKLSAPSDMIYLTTEELGLIKGLDLTKQPRLERVRDLFLFECATGLRYSDLGNLKPEDIKGNFLEVTVIKTMDKLRIPLVPMARQILDKYNQGLPRVFSNPRMNQLLKEVAELAQINEPIRLVKYKANKRLEETRLKHELVTTHTARRTFVTQSLERGMRPEIIMKITGHKDIKTMMRYVKITEKKVEEEMLKAWA